VESHAFDGASLNEPQRFYATWNADALRMAWEGANWDYEGDLFIYLDTTSGGAETLYTPYTATMTNTTIYLPGNFPAITTTTWPEFEQIRHTQLITSLLDEAMQADYLVWATSDLTATLLTWDGSAWVSPTLLSADYYRWNDGLTDLYLPFSPTLGITQPATTALNLLAVASEEDALRLWATMPDRNLVDSDIVVNPTAALATKQEHIFALTRPYHWYSLGDGICPNDPLSALTGETYPDTDLRVRLTVNPVGTTYALMGDDLYHQWRAFYQDEGPEQRQFDFLDHNHPPLGQGSVVTYTLSVANRGPVAASGVQALVSAYYALTLPGAIQDAAGYREYKTLDLGTVAPGATASATFTGTVEVENNWRYTQCRLTQPVTVCQPLLEWATLEGQVFDERTPLTITAGLPEGPAWDWLWADHQVDVAPPEYVGIDAPQVVVAPLTNTVSGYASDPSGVPTIEVQVRDPLSATTIITCADTTPDDGRWECPWVVSGNDGDEFDLRARATDGYGHVSEWTAPWRTVVLDSTPPTVTLQAAAQDAVDGQLIGTEGYLLTGLFTDTHSPGAVDVCRQVDGETVCASAVAVLSTQAPTDTERLYDDVPGAPVAIGAACLTRTFTVSESFFAADVNLGFTAAISNREELALDLFSPAGTSARLIAGVVSDTIYANYDVWLDDAASGALHNSADDDPTEPYFDRPARPDASLSAFNGEPVSGTWTLRVCDLLPLVNTGYYSRARLSLSPPSNALSSAGRWGYGLPTPAGMDSVTQTVAIYSLDNVGNRLAAPIGLTYLLDTVAPVLTATQIATQMPPQSTTPVLVGQVSDGGEMEAIYVRVDPPDGASYRDTVTMGDWHRIYLPLVMRGATGLQSKRLADRLRPGSASANNGGSAENWYYTPRSHDEPGTYTYWLEAYDQAGNVTVLGPYEVQVSRRIYLPLVTRN
ncbi:MAG: hypothetical protein DRI81_17365, partial [Chloroflexi bacterium]